MEAKKDFASAGSEAFKIPEKDKEAVVLNIEEEKPKTIVLETVGKTNAEKNALTRTWHKLNNFLLTHSKIKTKEKADFFHLLAVMVNSGIPMVRALKSLVAQMESNPHLRMILEDLYLTIESGSSLSEAMFKYPKIFTDAEVGMIQSGEASGQLSRVLENLATDAEKAHSIKSKVKSAMIYPVVIFILLIVVISAMMIFVIPKLTDLFASIEGELPLITRIVVGLSDFMIHRWVVLLGIIAVLFAAITLFKKTDFGRYSIDNLKLHLPLFGTLLKKAYLSRFARSLSNLLDSNVSIVKTLEITANSMGNEVYRKRLLLAMEDIKQGIPLAENLTSTSLFPPMLVNMIDVGEKTAQLDEITAKVAVFYENEVDTSVEGLSKIMEPLILVIIGLTVGAVVASIMLPIMKLSTLSGAL